MTAIKVNWSFNLAIEAGPRLSTSNPPIEVTGYDFVRGLIPKGTTTAKEVVLEVQPTAGISGAGAKVVFLAILGEKFDSLSYATAAGSATKTKLDGPQILLGEGAVSLLGSSAPTKLYFENSSATDDLQVEIIVGRKAS